MTEQADMEQSIADFYAGKNVFITGATGFMGKVLIEKLLRSCPEIGAIYILVRSKHGKSSEERWNTITDLELFDRLKKEFPGNLNKVKVLDGQLHLKKFGLSNKIYDKLKNEVTILFHSAASVRFVEHLKSAFYNNVLSTKNVLDFVSEIKNFQVLAHMSTAYANSHFKEVEEKIYPPVADWRETMKIVEEIDLDELNILTAKYIQPLVNSYTFTKHLAEQVVNEYQTKIPIVILRPTIVVPSWREPLPGWVDSLNGPIGLNMASATGIISCSYSNADLRPDFIPVDVSIQALLVAVWKKANATGQDKKKLDVYNTSSRAKSVTCQEFADIGLAISRQYPFSDVIWYPRQYLTTNFTWFRIQNIFRNYLPALMADSFLRFTNKKPMVVKAVKDYISAVNVLGVFMVNEWNFKNDKFMSLLNDIPQNSRNEFDFEFRNLDHFEYFLNSFFHMEKFFLKKTTNNLDDSKKRLNRLYWLDVILKSLSSCGFAYLTYNWIF